MSVGGTSTGRSFCAGASFWASVCFWLPAFSVSLTRVLLSRLGARDADLARLLDRGPRQLERENSARGSRRDLLGVDLERQRDRARERPARALAAVHDRVLRERLGLDLPGQDQRVLVHGDLELLRREAGQLRGDDRAVGGRPDVDGWEVARLRERQRTAEASRLVLRASQPVEKTERPTVESS